MNRGHIICIYKEPQKNSSSSIFQTLFYHHISSQEFQMASDSPAYADTIISSPPSPDNSPAVVVVVFVSLGCIIFFAFCLFALCFLMKRRRKNRLVQETDIKRGDEHFKVKEDIVKGPHGSEAVVLSIEEDKHFEEEIIKKEKQIDGKLIKGKNRETDIEVGESSSNLSVHKS